MEVNLILFVPVLVAVLHLPVCTSCPIDMKSREDGTCCRPTVCQKGEGYKLCDGRKEKPGEDSCFKCPEGTYNKDKIETGKMDFFVNVCQPLDCSCDNVGSIITNLKECQQGQTKLCVCNRMDLFYGEDPKACKLADEAMQARIKRKGFELTNSGTVAPCEKGYFKAEADLSICKKHTMCLDGYIVKKTGTSKTDNKCEKVFVEVKNISFDRDKNENITKEPEKGTTSPKETPIWVIILGAVVFGVVFIIIVTSIICIFACKDPEKYQWIHNMKARMKARIWKRPIEEIYSEPDSEIPNAEQSDQPLMPSMVSNDAESMPTYVQVADLTPDSGTSVDETVDDDDDDDEHTSNTFIKMPGSSSSTNCQNKPIGLVSPSIRTESRDDRAAGPNSRSEEESVSERGPIASPQQNDMGELVIAGQRVREDPYHDDQHDLQLDSGVVEDN